jgi:RimJ/RimL family protein N-acetyltransferase
MTPTVHLETARLRLRDWTDSDAEPFAAMNADPEVMAFMSRRLDRVQSDAFLAANRAAIAANGYGLYALEVKESGNFIGFVGLAKPAFEAPFLPATEIGWRLARPSWGKGLASEAARAVLRHAFETLGFDDLVSFTSVVNTRSRAVMERIGMTRDPAEDFLHPKLAPDNPLAPHVLYRIDRRQWLAREAAANLSR